MLGLIGLLFCSMGVDYDVHTVLTVVGGPTSPSCQAADMLGVSHVVLQDLPTVRMVGGEVASSEPQLLENDSQLLFWHVDECGRLVQVRCMLLCG
jgi:hypothetical protein